jgi:hypothetical protein
VALDQLFDKLEYFHRVRFHRLHDSTGGLLPRLDDDACSHAYGHVFLFLHEKWQATNETN